MAWRYIMKEARCTKHGTIFMGDAFAIISPLVGARVGDAISSNIVCVCIIATFCYY